MQRFGDYVLLEGLGAGGMGSVYRARHTGSGQEVALKLPNAQHALDGPRQARFEREGRLTAALRHPNVLTVHAAGVVDGRPYLAFQLVEDARTLGEYHRVSDLRGRVRAVRDAALGLAYAHAQGVLHRDVKPDNVLVDARGHVRVADFGVATAEGEDRLTRTGALVGTPLYMAPEAILRGRAGLTDKVDVYALGVLLYEALTGQHPFADQGLPALVTPDSRQIDPPRRLTKVPAPLNRLCLAALRSEPDPRPDAAEFARALTDWLDGKVERPWSRVLVGLVLVAAVATGGLVAAARAERPAPSPRPPPSPAPSPEDSAAAPPDPAVREAALRRALALATAEPVSFADLLAALEDLAAPPSQRDGSALAAELAAAVFHLQTHTKVADAEKVPVLEAFAATGCQPRDHDQPGLIDGWQTFLHVIGLDPEPAFRMIVALFRIDLRVTQPLLNKAIEVDFARAQLARGDLDPVERYTCLRALYKKDPAAAYPAEMREASLDERLGPRARAQGLARVHVGHGYDPLSPAARRDVELAYQLDPDSPRVCMAWAVALLQTPARREEGQRVALDAWERWLVRRRRPTLSYQDVDYLPILTSALLDAGRPDWAEAFVDRAQRDADDAGYDAIYRDLRVWVTGYRQGDWPEIRDAQVRRRQRPR